MHSLLNHRFQSSVLSSYASKVVRIPRFQLWNAQFVTIIRDNNLYTEIDIHAHITVTLIGYFSLLGDLCYQWGLVMHMRRPAGLVCLARLDVGG